MQIDLDHFIDTYYRAFLDLCLHVPIYHPQCRHSPSLVVIGGYGYSDHMGMVMMPEVVGR
ncbi:MAG: hypothetical protein U5J63_02965 [Fodinibius sp.]|nr:hypothetical protein [Fodinibius sp.]